MREITITANVVSRRGLFQRNPRARAVAFVGVILVLLLVGLVLVGQPPLGEHRRRGDRRPHLSHQRARGRPGDQGQLRRRPVRSQGRRAGADRSHRLQGRARSRPGRLPGFPGLPQRRPSMACPSPASVRSARFIPLPPTWPTPRPAYWPRKNRWTRRRPRSSKPRPPRRS